MKITLENTTKIVDLVVNGARVPARIWQGETEDGTPVQAFERDLSRQADPRPTVAAIPFSLII